MPATPAQLTRLQRVGVLLQGGVELDEELLGRAVLLRIGVGGRKGPHERHRLAGCPAALEPPHGNARMQFNSTGAMLPAQC